jgi:hypothetical protein
MSAEAEEREKIETEKRESKAAERREQEMHPGEKFEIIDPNKPIEEEEYGKIQKLAPKTSRRKLLDSDKLNNS